MIEIRPPRPGDEPAVQTLLAQLGYPNRLESVRSRLDALAKQSGDPVLLATEAGDVLGLIALHWAAMLHVGAPVARITALVVRDDARGKGIGRALVDAGAAQARKAGCASLELTTSVRRADAHAFYMALGFTSSSLHLRRSLES